jgi:hypothetical protein
MRTLVLLLLTSAPALADTGVDTDVVDTDPADTDPADTDTDTDPPDTDPPDTDPPDTDPPDTDPPDTDPTGPGVRAVDLAGETGGLRCAVAPPASGLAVLLTLFLARRKR